MNSLYQTLTRIDQIQNFFTNKKNGIKSTKPSEKISNDLAIDSAGAETKGAPNFIDYLNKANNKQYPFSNLVEKASKKYGLPDTLIKSVIQVESNFDAKALSPKGAMGLMQLMPKTAAQYHIKKPYFPEANIDTGSKHLKKLLEHYDGNLIKALGAYNAGGNSFINNNIPPYQETQNYIKKVIQNYMKFNGVTL